MKKVVSIFLLSVMMIVASLSLIGCEGVVMEKESYLKFGKNYICEQDTRGDNSKTYEKLTMVFNEDKTGELEGYVDYENLDYPKYSYVKSYTIKFKWRWADTDKSGVYIFETERIYHNDNTEGKYASISDLPYIIGEDFIALSAGDIYILEGSDIYGVENELRKEQDEEIYSKNE